MRANKTLTVIPAKGHSRRIQGKNLALLNGKPLVVHTIEQAFASDVCGEICVGTDEREIAEVAKKAGASVPFLRENDIDDITPVGVAAVNLLKRYKNELGRKFDYICLLLTTSPLRRPEDIRGCREVLMSDPSLDAAMSFVFSEKHPCWAWEFNSSQHIKPMFPEKCDFDRHELSKPYYVDGAVYWAKADFFEKVGGNQYRGKIGGYVMPQERAVDVDIPLDLEFCEFLLQKKRL